VTDPLHELRPFESAADLAGTILRAAVQGAGSVLSLRYVLRAPAGRWRVPDPRPDAARADGLWEHSCFEAFVAPTGGTGYWEVNLSPSGDWNVYRFDGYREGMRPEVRARTPAIRLERASCGTLTLHAGLDLASITELSTHPLEVGLAAVLESTDGVLSYWAMAHTPAKPDFHRRESFVVRLGAEEPA
jgi:hypothetical protein